MIGWLIQCKNVPFTLLGHRGGGYKIPFWDSPPLSTLLEDVELGCEALYRQCEYSWWHWTLASVLLFWRWPAEIRTPAKRGYLPWALNKLHRYVRKPPPPKPVVYSLYVSKFKDIIEKGYVRLALSILSYMDYFDVRKPGDIRMVYNRTTSSLTATVWAPNYWLPTARTAVRCLSYNYCTVDKDLGESFLNFPLPHKFRLVSGIQLGRFKN